MEEGLSKVFQLALEQGIWAALYLYLFFRMLKENRERETRYQTTIEQLSGSIASGIYVPTDFDTKEKALSKAKVAEKGLK